MGDGISEFQSLIECQTFISLGNSLLYEEPLGIAISNRFKPFVVATNLIMCRFWYKRSKLFVTGAQK
jgi:hypothetical protein